jgi:hypothetical protein
VESCERRAKDLFRDARRHFEKACAGSHKPTGERLAHEAPNHSNGNGEAQGALTARYEEFESGSENSDSSESSSPDESETGEAGAPGSSPGATQKRKKKRQRKPAAVTPTEGDDDYEHPLPRQNPTAPSSRPGSRPGSAAVRAPASTKAPETIGALPDSARSTEHRQGAGQPVPLLAKRALLGLLLDKTSAWAQRAAAQKGSRALVARREFEPCFVLHPVAAKKGFVTADEFALFCVATQAVLDR